MAVEITEEFVWQSIPRRARDSHKGTFGSVLAVAGSAFYRGAALLAAEGALRTGAGIVTLASVEPVVGAAVYLLVFRRLAKAPALARVVASIGLFLYLWAMVGLRFPNPPAIRRILPSRAIQILGHPVFQDRLWSAVVAVVVTALLWATFRFARFGLATIAASESPVPLNVRSHAAHLPRRCSSSPSRNLRDQRT